MARHPDLDQLAINTIRTLVDGCRPEAEVAIPARRWTVAPVAYTLWTRVLRYDPADPHWPGRDRFILSAGHASMLLYSVLHLAGVKRHRRGRSPTARAGRIARRYSQFPPVGQPLPGHPEYGWTSGVETTTAARPGRCDQRRHGDRPPMAPCHLQPAGLRRVRLQRLCPVRRRRHDGGRRQRGGIDGRSPAAVQSVAGSMTATT